MEAVAEVNGEEVLLKRWKEIHAKNRIMERFGVELNDGDLQSIQYEIEEGLNIPVWIDNKDGRSFHNFTFYGNSMVLLYDWQHSCVLTAYRKSWFDSSNESQWKLKSNVGGWKPKKRERKKR